MCNNNDNNNNNNRDSNCDSISSDIIPCILSNSRHNISTRNLLPIDHYRLELYQYTIAERLRYPMMNSFSSALPCYPFLPRIIQPEEPKPQHSYIGLIAMAILSTPEGKLVLSDIYQHILDHYPYFRTRGPGWRNSIRHNLSLNDCFIKVGRSANGKGHYWAIHPANIDDFRKGDFRRRKAQRKVRKHMGLDVDNDSLDSSSPPPPPSLPPLPPPPQIVSSPSIQDVCGPSSSIIPQSLNNFVSTKSNSIITSTVTNMITETSTKVTYQYENDQHKYENLQKSNKKKRRRQFNMDSLLAPDSSDENNLNDDDLDQSDLIVSKKSNRLCSSSATSASTSVSTKLWPTSFPLVDYYQVLLQSQIEPEINSHLNS